MFYKTPKLSSGVVLGRFMPPHTGHLYLLEFAANLVRELTIVVDPGIAASIAIERRCEWLRELVPGAEVIALETALTDEKELLRGDAAAEIRNQMGTKPNIVFGGDETSLEFAALIGATYVPVDTSIVPIRSSEILENPLIYWERVPRCVRPYFVKRVCVFGPESTGKSTLAKKLAEHYQTVAVPEYARVFLDSRQNVLDLEEFKFYARGQLASEDALARSANRVLFCDTDALTTLMWSDWLYQKQDPWIVDLAKQRTYDLYLLTDVDVPWVRDPQRYFPEERRRFHDYCLQTLMTYERGYVEVKGSWSDRFETAKTAVDAILCPPAGRAS